MSVSLVLPYRIGDSGHCQSGYIYIKFHILALDKVLVKDQRKSQMQNHMR